ncbi:MAG: Family 10 xylanase [Microgenomates group bacterium GW2011_GWC1_37_8]|uniref:Family 10 xylanase n=1 Tax=Candidatus Woesebacteria bacterium GW2011_GWB1_38_8 TaxID=1618570 RepID=A0A0G0L4N4_9BACT|nr:MAG: Family 10 xylanase [Microgenomates group bacterium GW2011_GWC1_37_8]KKQ85992.1 MAG: Family 10 xylanase [Candidatus Woesebacteria bacterium GW2011_GWB1_38_8]
MDKKKVIFVILTILLILGGVGAGVYLVQQSAEYREKAAPATTIAFTASNSSPLLGQNIDVNVEVNTGENNIMIAELNINFDPTRLEVLEVSPGNFFTNPATIGPRIDNTQGTIYYVLYLPTNATPKQGQGILAKISFSTKELGSATVNIAPNTIVGDTSEQGTVAEGPRNVLIGTTPLTINVLAATTPTNTPTPTTPAGVSPTAVPSPTSGIGGNGSVTPTPTRTPTSIPTTAPTQSASSSSSPTPTTEIPPIPNSGISLPTLIGVSAGVLLIALSLMLAL